MKFLASLLFLLASIVSVFSIENTDYFSPRTSLPQDMQLALSHLQFHSPQDESINKKIVILDQYLDFLTEEERLFFGKSELYKALFRAVESIKVKNEYYEMTALEISRRANRELQGLVLTHPFLQYLFASITSDLQSIMIAPGSQQTLKKFRATNSQLTTEEELIKQKLKYILPWIQVFQQAGLERCNQLLILALKDYLSSLISRSDDFLFMSRAGKLSIIPNKSSGLSFFDQKKFPPGLKTSKKEQGLETPSLEAILEPILSIQESLPKPVDDWKPKESAQDFFQMRPDPNYQAPENLPTPLNDWIQSL